MFGRKIIEGLVLPDGFSVWDHVFFFSTIVLKQLHIRAVLNLEHLNGPNLKSRTVNKPAVF